MTLANQREQSTTIVPDKPAGEERCIKEYYSTQGKCEDGHWTHSQTRGGQLSSNTAFCWRQPAGCVYYHHTQDAPQLSPHPVLVSLNSLLSLMNSLYRPDLWRGQRQLWGFRLPWFCSPSAIVWLSQQSETKKADDFEVFPPACSCLHSVHLEYLPTLQDSRQRTRKQWL